MTNPLRTKSRWRLAPFYNLSSAASASQWRSLDPLHNSLSTLGDRQCHDSVLTYDCMSPQ